MLYLLSDSEPKFQELCQTEVFRAQCTAADEVLFIKSALYGRMKIGKCVQTDYGHVGCNADVMQHTDRRCSGKRKCQIPIPDPVLDKVKSNCPKEFKLYLQIFYECMQGK